MLFRAKKPVYDEVDGEYVIPLRLSEDATHLMIGGWYPMGIGHGHLRPRKDGTFDMFVKPPTATEINAVPLDRVSQALMAALDLALYVSQDESLADEVRLAADRVKDLVAATSE